MGIYSNGLRSQQQPLPKPGKDSKADKVRDGDGLPRADAPAATGVACDAKTVRCTETEAAMEALREIAAQTPRRWP